MGTIFSILEAKEKGIDATHDDFLQKGVAFQKGLSSNDGMWGSGKF